MDNVKDNRYFIKKILNDADFIIKHTSDVSIEQLSINEVLLDSVMFRLVQIAESATRLTTDFKLRHLSIDWQAINGLRNRIVHDYGKVDLSIIYDTIKCDIPNLYKYLDGVNI